MGECGKLYNCYIRFKCSGRVEKRYLRRTRSFTIYKYTELLPQYILLYIYYMESCLRISMVVSIANQEQTL